MPIFIPVQVMQRPIRSMSLMKVAEFPCSGRKLQVADELELQNPRQDELCTLVIFLGACHQPISLGSLLLLPPLSATLRPCGCDYSYGPRVESQAAAYYTLSSNSHPLLRGTCSQEIQSIPLNTIHCKSICRAAVGGRADGWQRHSSSEGLRTSLPCIS